MEQLERWIGKRGEGWWKEEEGGGFYSEANGSKEIKEHSLHEKLPRRNIVCEVRERERGRNVRRTV